MKHLVWTSPVRLLAIGALDKSSFSVCSVYQGNDLTLKSTSLALSGYRGNTFNANGLSSFRCASSTCFQFAQ